jgi:hypothetical protein
MTNDLLLRQLKVAVDALVAIAARGRYHGLGSVSIARAALHALGRDANGRRRE